MPRAGTLRHLVTVQQNTQTQGAMGGLQNSWTTYATMRARIEPLSGKEVFDSQHDVAEATTLFVVRYSSEVDGITPAMRISWDSRTFDIIAPPINKFERNREVHILTREQL